MQSKPAIRSFAPLPVRLWAGKIREPDLIFMTSDHESRIGDYWGVPDLVVEIVSPGSEWKDRELKRLEYATAGVAEYWIVDPVAETVEVLGVAAGDDYSISVLFGKGEILSSRLLKGFSLSLPELFAER